MATAIPAARPSEQYGNGFFFFFFFFFFYCLTWLRFVLLRGQGGARRRGKARLKEANIVVAERIEEIPVPGQGPPRPGSGGMRSDALFIGVEVDDEVAGSGEIAAKLGTEVCPVDIFATGDDGSLPDRRGQPRRMRPVRAVPGGCPGRRGQGAQALRGRRRPRALGPARARPRTRRGGGTRTPSALLVPALRRPVQQE